MCSTRPCGDATVGVDKGYTEAYTDSDGERHGKGLGDLLAAESDHQKGKGQKRNQLRSVTEKHEARGHHRKADNIRTAQSGPQQVEPTQAQTPKASAQPAVPGRPRRGRQGGHHRLRGPVGASMQSAKYRHRDINRRPNGWVKGMMADTLTSISRRRGSATALVNPAYTSQIDSRTGLLQGTSSSWDRFHCMRRGCAGRGRQCRLQYSGEAVR